MLSPEYEKCIDTIRNRYGEYVFRCGISHLMDVGIRHLTPKDVAESCEIILEQDDNHSPFDNEMLCGIIRCAGDLAEIPHIELLCYIQQYVFYGRRANQ